MTTSYSRIIKQIETLQRQAETARSKEIAGVVSRIKEAVAFYRLTAADLGLSEGGARTSTTTKGSTARPPKFADGSGKTWGGRGPRPAWLTEALANGKQLSDFALEGARPTTATATPRSRKALPKGRKVAAKYRDEHGNTWAGRGLQPRWFKDAIAEGKTPESMLI